MLSSDKGGGGGTAGGRLGLQQPPRDDDREGSSSSCSPLPALSTTELEMTNLELLHHFTTTTYVTLSMDDDLREMWRLAVPRLAFSYEFVMHALLAISALHLNFLVAPDKSYAVVAAGHHGKALGSLRTAFPALHKEHAEALYAASLLTARYVYACPPIVESTLPSAPRWIPVFRGIYTIIHRGWDWMRQGELFPLLAQKVHEKGRDPHDRIEFQDSLFDLSKRGVHSELDPEELEDDRVLEIYRAATADLKVSWDLFWSIGPREFAVIRWLSNMSDEFLRYIVEQRPRALVLLAHHCVMIGSLDEPYWWAKGKGIDEIKRIEGVLDEKWKPWLDWPIAKCKIPEGAG